MWGTTSSCATLRGDSHSGFEALLIRDCRSSRSLAVNKHRRRTPGYVRANPLIEFVNLADNRGPDRRRSGPYPERISSCYIKALRSSELGSRFGAYSHRIPFQMHRSLLLRDINGPRRHSRTPSSSMRTGRIIRAHRAHYCSCRPDSPSSI